MGKWAHLSLSLSLSLSLCSLSLLSLSALSLCSRHSVPSPVKVKPAYYEVSAWFQAMCTKPDAGNGGIQEIDATNTGETVGKHLKLPVGLTWIGKPGATYPLFVRPCYEKLFDLVNETWNKSMWNLILGTPGQTSCQLMTSCLA